MHSQSGLLCFLGCFSENLRKARLGLLVLGVVLIFSGRRDSVDANIADPDIGAEFQRSGKVFEIALFLLGLGRVEGGMVTPVAGTFEAQVVEHLAEFGSRLLSRVGFESNVLLNPADLDGVIPGGGHPLGGLLERNGIGGVGAKGKSPTTQCDFLHDG